MNDERTDVKALPPAELEARLATLGASPYRAGQVRSWLFARGAASFDEMTDLPKDLRARLAAAFRIERLEPLAEETSADGTRKFLFGVPGGERIESVLIPAERRSLHGGERRTLCISSQAGCAMGCAFCATARLGLRRQLAAWEIAEQVLHVGRRLGPAAPITNVVFMGMGEPLHNYESVVAAIALLGADWGARLSPRRITVSTVGLVPAMERLLAETRAHLAVSLSGTTDAARGRLMPVNRKYPLADLLDACRRLPLPRRRRITFEYVMLAGENDAIEDADRLARLLRGIPAKVNLIPWNPVAGTDFRPSPRPAIDAFRERLLGHGIHATVRETRGRDIHAACGQLAASA